MTKLIDLLQDNTIFTCKLVEYKTEGNDYRYYPRWEINPNYKVTIINGHPTYQGDILCISALNSSGAYIEVFEIDIQLEPQKYVSSVVFSKHLNVIEVEWSYTNASI